MLGDAAAAVKTALRTVVPTAALGANAAEQELALMQLAAVWHSCHALQGQFATRRARMEEDPNKVPEMAQEDHAEFRSRFVTAHPDVILLDAKEPHKKFVEKISRDFMVHGMVPYYPVAEIRTRADSIVQKTGLTKNAEDLLTISKAEEPDQVTDVQTLLHRVHALFMALEYLKHLHLLQGCRSAQIPARARTVQSGLPWAPLHRGGGRADPQESSPPPIRTAGELCHVRGGIGGGAQQSQILVERCSHQSCSGQGRSSSADRQRGPRSRPGESGQDRCSFRSPAEKRNNKEAGKTAAEVKPVQKEQFDKKKDKIAKPDKDKRIPESEWKLISQAASSVSGQKRCHYFNSSMGCALADKCRFKHLCMTCGAAHPMVGNH